MSFTLSPADSRLLRQVLTRSLVSITPDSKSSTDVNGNEADETRDSKTDVNSLHILPSLSSSSPPSSSDKDDKSSSGIVCKENPDFMTDRRNMKWTHPDISSPSTVAPSSSPSSSSPLLSTMSTSCSVNNNNNSTNNNNNNNNNNSSSNNNHPPPVLNLAKIDEAQEEFTTPLRTFQLCSPIGEEGTTIIVTSATPEKNTDTVDTTELNGVLCPISTPPSKRLKETVCGASELRNAFKSPCIRRSDITFGRFIGKGGFGTVHQGTIGGEDVAIKVVKKRRGSGIHREILQAERLAYRLNLRHKNIVAILGVNMCDDLRGDALIVMELVTSRSLQELLDDTTRILNRRERLRLAVEIASALHYLHSNDVAHLDVKPANVLMTSEIVCKLSDFGNLTRTSANVAREEVEYTQLLGTLPYRAPELMQGLFPSTKADMYSYGIVLWQMFTREQPHKNANPHWLIYQVVKGHIRPNIPDPGTDEAEVIYTNLYTSCWDGDANSRPTAGTVLDFLSSLQQRIS